MRSEGFYYQTNVMYPQKDIHKKTFFPMNGGVRFLFCQQAGSNLV